MKVRKTRVRPAARTLAHGCFRLHETEYACRAGCRHPSGRRVAIWSSDLSLLPRSSTGYDAMVFVGTQRYIEYRQREEIRAALAAEYGIRISTGEVSRLARLFLSYLERLHFRRRGQIREALASAGGWALHIDSTGEDGRGTLLVLYVGQRRWVLEAAKIPTECSEAILPWIERVAAWAGDPLAIMRDLSRAMIKACEAFRVARDGRVRILACHYHFLADVGKDLLDAAHGGLRDLFRHSKVRPKLRDLVRQLGRKLGSGITEIRLGILAWQTKEDAGHRLPEGPDGVGAVRALAQWILDYPIQSTGKDFPFVLPYLDFFDRCHTARRAIDAFLRTPPADRTVLRTLKRLQRILDKIAGDVSFKATTKILRRRASLFGELRDALRLTERPTPHDLTTMEEVQDVEKAIEELTESLKLRRPSRGPAEDEREAIDIILDHLVRHGESLKGHLIPLPEGTGEGALLVERTNDNIEGFFHTLKHDERRRSGRKILTQDFESLPAAAALARNLKRPDYVAIICGPLHELPRVFKELDDEDNARELAGEEPLGDVEETAAEAMKTATASLPIEDRRVIRTDAMNDRIRNAARSRAPRSRPVAAVGA